MISLNHTITCRFKRASLFLLACCIIYVLPAYAQPQQKKVMANKGDGVYSILRNNGLDPVKYSQVFIELNKENLNTNNGLYVGKNYLLPSVGNDISQQSNTAKTDVKPAKTETINYPIFGQAYADVSIENQKLDGAVYYLISGHGGPDPGAVVKQGEKLTSEDEYAYDVTLRLARKLISRGAKVFMIIKDPNDGIRDQRILEVDYDEVTHPNKRIPRSQKLRLKQRTRAVNTLYTKNKPSYQRLIVTHVDSRSKGENIDVFFYHHENSKKGKQLAETIQQTFKSKYARYQPNRKYSGTVGPRSDLYVVKNTLPATVYIELGNIKNTKDQKRILDHENRDALAKWIAEGLIEDFAGK